MLSQLVNPGSKYVADLEFFVLEQLYGNILLWKKLELGIETLVYAFGTSDFVA